jgi:hypothetical protein
MRTGNIVKTAYGDIVIVTRVSDDYVHWISASHANSLGSTQKLTTEHDVDCVCVEECCEPSIDCPHCEGKGKIKVTKRGMDRATYLADNMLDYIKKGMMKNFEF